MKGSMSILLLRKKKFETRSPKENLYFVSDLLEILKSYANY